MTRILTIMAMTAITLCAWSNGLTDSLRYTVRLGYNIGGTAPIGMPATIRSLNEYKLKSNLSLGIDVHKHIKGRWGVMAGLRVENKGMETDATVKNYHMTIVKGGQPLEGYFTGNNRVRVDEWLLTVPVMATYDAGKNVRIKLGPYVSYVQTKKFDGYVYDGYLRQNTPTGPKIEIGNTESTRGSFDFSDDMRRFQFGIDAGVDWYFSKRWGAYADIAWGVTGIHKSDFKTIEQTLYPIFGTLGVIYKLK
ncbi:MAG: PorT family protein [Prevotella sp.]|nr:PorT family protein [Prevotella sp.]